MRHADDDRSPSVLTRAARRLNRSDSFGRVVDVWAAAVALVLLAPLFAAVGIAVRLTMGRPVLFRQERAGRDGVPFTILKFRTMEMRGATCCGDPAACRGLQLAPGRRVHRLAAVLRRTGFDELPQLLNILRGEMSFAGPRPLLVRYVSRYTGEQRRRLLVKPGITGWAQVNGRTDLSWNARLALDAWYARHRTRTLDLEIARRTLRAMVRGSGYSQVGSDTGPEFLGTGVALGICPATELPLSSVAPRRSVQHVAVGQPPPATGAGLGDDDASGAR